MNDIYGYINIKTYIVMGCGCKQKQNQQAEQPQQPQTQAQPQQPANGSNVQESVKKIVQKYYRK